MTAFEHILSSFIANLPATLLALAALLKILQTFRKAVVIEKNTNGPVADLVKQTSAILAEWDAAKKAILPPASEDVRQSE